MKLLIILSTLCAAGCTVVPMQGVVYAPAIVQTPVVYVQPDYQDRCEQRITYHGPLPTNPAYYGQRYSQPVVIVSQEPQVQIHVRVNVGGRH